MNAKIMFLYDYTIIESEPTQYACLLKSKIVFDNSGILVKLIGIDETYGGFNVI